MGVIDLEKGYVRVNREALWQMLRMYDVGGKLLNGIKSTYFNSLACFRVKEGDSYSFRINSILRQECYIPWCCNVYVDAVMK